MYIIINPEYTFLNDFITKLPYFFDEKGDTLYRGRNELKMFDTGQGKVVVKSFKIPLFINGFVYSFLRKSKANRSYYYSLEIQKRGFDIPAPIAYIEIFKFGLLTESYYISAYSDGATMRDFSFIKALTEEKADILKAFAVLTARLHKAGVYHPDYSNGNILYKREKEKVRFDLVDVNRMQFREVTEKMAYKSFHRLDFSLEMLEIVAREYALQRGFDVEKSIAKITEYNLKTMKPYQSFHLPKPD